MRIRILVPISQQIVGIFMHFLKLEEKEICRLKLLARMLAAAQKNPSQVICGKKLFSLYYP